MTEDGLDKGIEATLINSSAVIDFLLILAFYILGSALNIFTTALTISLFLFTFLILLLIYHASWSKLILHEDCIEIRSIFPINPLYIPYSDVKKTKSTGYTIVIDYKGLKKKIKMDLFFPIWAEFLTYNVKGEYIEKMLNKIEEKKEQKMDDELSKLMPSLIKNQDGN